MIKSITTSKLFITSSRQQSILAAMQNPMNVELVQQMSEYLSDESKEDLKEAISENQAEDSKTDALTSGEVDSEDTGTVFAPNDEAKAKSIPAPSSDGNVFDEFSFADSEDSSSESEESTSAESASVEESIEVFKSPIMSTTDVESISIPVLKGTLNANSDTSGVNRIEINDSELWVYYEDEVNLNDVMISVIEILNATGYTCLKFNRLGRSNNAIIFDIKQEHEDIRSIEEIAEDE